MIKKVLQIHIYGFYVKYRRFAIAVRSNIRRIDEVFVAVEK